GTEKSSFDETWKPVWGEETEIRNHYNEMKRELQESTGKQRKLNLIFRAFDDGIGFRYEFPEQANLTEFEIAAELTGFTLVEDHEAWWIPAYKGEFYEMLYKKTAISAMDTVSLPLTMETKDR